MATVRRVWIGTRGIKDLVKQYKLLQQDVAKYTEAAHEYVVERATDEYRGRLADDAGVDVEWQSTGKSWRARIINRDINAKFVEYGTGLNGVNTFPGGTPNPEGGAWVYNSGKHSGQDEYIQMKNGKTLHVPYGQWIPPGDMPYTDPKTGQKHIFTCGQKAQAPMYLTTEDVKKNATTWVRTSFAQHGIELKEE